MPLIVKSNTEKPESNGVTDKSWEPKSVKTIFWFPGSSSASTNPERKTITNELTINHGNCKSHPVIKRDLVQLLVLGSSWRYDRDLQRAFSLDVNAYPPAFTGF